MPPCRLCLSHGVPGEVLPGMEFCAAHGGASCSAAAASSPAGPPGLRATEDEDVSTNLTQAIGGLMTEPSAEMDTEMAALDAIDIDVAVATAGPPLPPGLPAPLESMDTEANGTSVTQGGEALQVGDEDIERMAAEGLTPHVDPRAGLLRTWFEEEVLQHFPRVHASTVQASDVMDMPVELPDSFDKITELLTKLGYALESEDPWAALGMARLEGPDPAETRVAARVRAARLLLRIPQDLHFR